MYVSAVWACALITWTCDLFLADRVAVTPQRSEDGVEIWLVGVGPGDHFLEVADIGPEGDIQEHTRHIILVKDVCDGVMVDLWHVVGRKVDEAGV